MGSQKRARPASAAEERRLVDRMRAGDERAFEAFAEQYIPGLYRFAQRRLADRELTKEIVQATVCKVIEKLGGFRGDAPLFTWLCACCANEIAAHYRRLGRRPREVELDEDAAETHAIERMETAELVHVSLDRLPFGYARILEWRYVEGLEVAEIAVRLETSYKAAESLLSRARAGFRGVYEQLAGAHDTGGPRDTGRKEGIAP